MSIKDTVGNPKYSVIPCLKDVMAHILLLYVDTGDQHLQRMKTVFKKPHQLKHVWACMHTAKVSDTL